MLITGPLRAHSESLCAQIRNRTFIERDCCQHLTRIPHAFRDRVLINFNLVELEAGAVTHGPKQSTNEINRTQLKMEHYSETRLALLNKFESLWQRVCVFLRYRRKIIRFRFRVHKSIAVSTQRVAACSGTKISTLCPRSNKAIKNGTTRFTRQ